MKCFILLYGSHSVSVLGVYISSVRGNPIKVSPRLEIHEKMRNILTIPPSPQPQTGAWTHVVTQSWGSDIAHKKSSQ